MNVYRLCRNDEIDKILTNRNFKNVGQCFQTDAKKNNFKYADGVRYLHFFKDASSLLYLNTCQGRFVCDYDIPDDILAERAAVGQYRDLINLNGLVPVPEYVVETDVMKFEYLKRVDKIIADIDYEDYFYTPTLKNFKENIYRQSNVKETEAERGI